MTINADAIISSVIARYPDMAQWEAEERENMAQAETLCNALDCIWDEMKYDRTSNAARIAGHYYDYLLTKLARRADWPHWGLAREYEARHDRYMRYLFG